MCIFLFLVLERSDRVLRMLTQELSIDLSRHFSIVSRETILWLERNMFLSQMFHMKHKNLMDSINIGIKITLNSYLTKK